MQAPVRMTAEWFVLPPETGPTVAVLNAFVLAARGEPGCLGGTVSTLAGERVLVRCEEEWRTEEDLQRHIRSSHFSRLAALMEAATEPPKVEFRLPGGIRGLEYAEAVRGEGGRAS